MTAALTTSTDSSWSLDDALQQLRTPTGLLLMATAGAGIFLGAHWPPLVVVMLGFYFVTLLAPMVARSSVTWFIVAAIWLAAVVARRNVMEDHVYLYLAWLVALAVALVHPPTALSEARVQGKRLIAIVFAVAALWKLLSMSFLNGAALWTIGLLDDRMEPLLALVGVSSDSLDQARPSVAAVVAADGGTHDIVLSSYASVALVLLGLGTIALEALVALTHAVPDTHQLAKLRVPVLVFFGIVTYAFVPVLPFALLLAVIGSTIASFDRRAVLAFTAMVLVTLVRFLTL